MNFEALFFSNKYRTDSIAVSVHCAVVQMRFFGISNLHINIGFALKVDNQIYSSCNRNSSFLLIYKYSTGATRIFMHIIVCLQINSF